MMNDLPITLLNPAVANTCECGMEQCFDKAETLMDLSRVYSYLSERLKTVYMARVSLMVDSGDKGGGGSDEQAV